MPKMIFTEKTVRTIKTPLPKRQVVYTEKLTRGVSLLLIASYGGSKSWRVQLYEDAGARTYALGDGGSGQWPNMPVAKAREKAKAFFEDPEREIAKVETGSFKEVAEGWVKRHVEKNGLRSKEEIKRRLNKYVYPEWKKKKFREIKRSDVTKLLDKVEDDHGATQADRVLADVSAICNWFASRNDDYNSPVVGAMLKVALLTGQRIGKVNKMQWKHVKDGVWAIETEDREKTNAEGLKLPEMVVAILEAQVKVKGNPFVFPAATGKGPFNSFSQRKEELDAVLPKEMPHWIIHDLRRTAKSLMSRARVDSQISERVLGHAIAGVEGVYDRHEYTDEKTEALNQLAKLVELILSPAEGGNVVALKQKTA